MLYNENWPMLSMGMGTPMAPNHDVMTAQQKMRDNLKMSNVRANGVFDLSFLVTVQALQGAWGIVEPVRNTIGPLTWTVIMNAPYQSGDAINAVKTFLALLKTQLASSGISARAPTAAPMVSAGGTWTNVAPNATVAQRVVQQAPVLAMQTGTTYVAQTSTSVGKAAPTAAMLGSGTPPTSTPGAGTGGVQVDPTSALSRATTRGGYVAPGGGVVAGGGGAGGGSGSGGGASSGGSGAGPVDQSNPFNNGTQQVDTQSSDTHDFVTATQDTVAPDGSYIPAGTTVAVPKSSVPWWAWAAGAALLYKMMHKSR